LPARPGGLEALDHVRIEAKLDGDLGGDGLRVHDLRRSFASFAIADGASLFLVGKLLGHTNSRTTERYAHLARAVFGHFSGRMCVYLVKTGGNGGNGGNCARKRLINICFSRFPLLVLTFVLAGTVGTGWGVRPI
jgi:hypothetical protein